MNSKILLPHLSYRSYVLTFPLSPLSTDTLETYLTATMVCCISYLIVCRISSYASIESLQNKLNDIYFSVFFLLLVNSFSFPLSTS